MAASLPILTQKGTIFKWNVESKDDFQLLKHALTNPPIMAHPIVIQPFLLHTETSQGSFDSVLAQRQVNKEHVIAYAGHTLRPLERKWATSGRLKHSSPTIRKLWHECPKLSIQHGILCRKVKQSCHTPAAFQVVLPATLISTALTGLHGNQFSGHLSAEHTLQRARCICYWPYMAWESIVLSA